MKKWVTKKGSTIYQVLSARSNVYLISNDKGSVLIDTSFRTNWGSLNEKLDKLCYHSKRPSALILTHAHFDHASNAIRIKEKYNAKVIVHRNEAQFLSKGETQIPKGTFFFTRWIDNIEKTASKFVKYNPVDYDVLVDDVYDMNELGFNSYILHTPGHTGGSVSVIIDNEIAIVGDTMFGMTRDSVLPPFADNLKTMVGSWKKLLDTECKYFLPAHGGMKSREILQKEYNKYRSKFIV